MMKIEPYFAVVLEEYVSKQQGIEQSISENIDTVDDNARKPGAKIISGFFCLGRMEN